MRTIQKYALGVCLLLTLSTSALAAPSNPGADPFTTVKKFIVKILDELGVKPGLPPG